MSRFKLRVVEKNDLNCWMMLDDWCEHFEKTKDAEIEGSKYPVRELIIGKISDGLIELMAITQDQIDIGLVAHSTRDGFIEGMVFWIKPEHRCIGTMETTFDLLLELARNRNLIGIRFDSKVWRNAPLLLGFSLEKTKNDGNSVVKTWVKKCTT